MHRASTILTTTRLDKELTPQDVSQKTKIPVKYLKAIEAEDVTTLPDEPYCSLIVKDYAQFLGLNGQHILSLFRRDILTRRRSPSIRRRIRSFTPQLAITFSLVLTLVVFGLYLFVEYRKFNQPPKLKVNWPEVSESSILQISGITDPEATIRINDALIVVNSDGSFDKEIDLSTHPTKIIIESRARGGQATVEERTY